MPFRVQQIDNLTMSHSIFHHGNTHYAACGPGACWTGFVSWVFFFCVCVSVCVSGLMICVTTTNWLARGTRPFLSRTVCECPPPLQTTLTNQCSAIWQCLQPSEYWMRHILLRSSTVVQWEQPMLALIACPACTQLTFTKVVKSCLRRRVRENVIKQACTSL